MAERHIDFLRNFGIAGHSIAWGGFAMFGAAISLGEILAFKDLRLSLLNRMGLWSLLLLSVINIMLSGSRTAMTSFAVVYLAFIVIGLFRLRRKFRFFFAQGIGFLLICAAFLYTIGDRFLFIVFRYSALADTLGGDFVSGDRTDQVKAGLALLDDPYAWIFGVGNLTQRTLATSFGTEVEPVYLLVNYGLLGLALRYGIVLVILVYSWRQLKRSQAGDRALPISAVLAIFGYAVFSLGYFFFQELYVGMLPWLLFGWVTGTHLSRYTHRSRCTFNASSLSRTTP